MDNKEKLRELMYFWNIKTWEPDIQHDKMRYVYASDVLERERPTRQSGPDSGEWSIFNPDKEYEEEIFHTCRKQLYDYILRMLKQDGMWDLVEQMNDFKRKEAASQELLMIKYDTPLDNLFTVEEFRDDVEDGGFIDYDGSGHPVKDGMMCATFCVLPSEVHLIPEDATHIQWYNR
jgi:hypothetical protein